MFLDNGSGWSSGVVSEQAMKKNTVKQLTRQQRKVRSKRKTDVKRKVPRSLQKTMNRQASMKAKKLAESKEV